MPGFTGLGEDNCTMRQETSKFGDLVCLVLEILQFIFCFKHTWRVPLTVMGQLFFSVLTLFSSTEICEAHTYGVHHFQCKNKRRGTLPCECTQLSVRWEINGILDTSVIKAYILLQTPQHRLRYCSGCWPQQYFSYNNNNFSYVVFYLFLYWYICSSRANHNKPHEHIFTSNKILMKFCLLDSIAKTQNYHDKKETQHWNYREKFFYWASLKTDLLYWY